MLDPFTIILLIFGGLALWGGAIVFDRVRDIHQLAKGVRTRLWP